MKTLLIKNHSQQIDQDPQPQISRLCLVKTHSHREEDQDRSKPTTTEMKTKIDQNSQAQFTIIVFSRKKSHDPSFNPKI